MIFKKYIANEKSYLDGLVKFIEGGKHTAETYIHKLEIGEQSIENEIDEQIEDLLKTIKTEADVDIIISVILGQIQEDESALPYWVSFNRIVQTRLESNDEKYKLFTEGFGKITTAYPNANDLLIELGKAFKHLSIIIEATMTLCSAITYVENYRIDRIDIEAIKNRKITEIPNWSEIFVILQSLRKNILELLVANTECSNADKKALMESIQSNDEESFMNIISRYSTETNILASGSDYYQLHSNDFDYEAYKECFSGSEIDEMIDILKSVCGDADSDFSVIETFLSSIGQMKAPDDINNSDDQFLKVYQALVNYYIAKKSFLDSKEQKIIDDLIHQEATEYLLDGMELSESTQFSDVPIFSSEMEFDSKECFNGIEPTIVNGGDEKFKRLINYIVESGYIENTDKTKQLFTYRLTGRLRPKGKLTKIQWNGRGNRSANELIYLVRFATDSAKTKYTKMTEFFEGPDFPTKNISGYGDQARIEFRRFLNELYPTIFGIKDISQY